jgi:hypothetical protein
MGKGSLDEACSISEPKVESPCWVWPDVMDDWDDVEDDMCGSFPRTIGLSIVVGTGLLGEGTALLAAVAAKSVAEDFLRSVAGRVDGDRELEGMTTAGADGSRTVRTAPAAGERDGEPSCE